MKKHIFAAIFLSLAVTTATVAQTKKPQKKTTKHQLVKKHPPTETSAKATLPSGTTNTSAVTLSSSSTNEAYSTGSRRFSIADPTINTLNERASGNNVPVSSSGIVGMPKGTYGFANGKILLRNTTALSSGTLYGSGAVGTGTTITGMGTAENVVGVNGKNPYAGPWLWGSRLPVRQVGPPAKANGTSTTGNQ